MKSIKAIDTARERVRLAFDQRNRDILRLVGDGLSKAEVARRMGISRERVRQIVARSESKPAHRAPTGS